MRAIPNHLPGSSMLRKLEVPLADPVALARRGCMISILNTPFFCHRLSTRTSLLYTQEARVQTYSA